MKVLLMGCGRSRKRKISMNGRIDFEGDDLITIDSDPATKPNIVMDLDSTDDWNRQQFEGCFDEIHAYDVLEHLGIQGDWRGFFDEFARYHDALKDGGRFFILVPIGEDAICDPGHKRFFSIKHFKFLNQQFYDTQTEMDAAIDYRFYWKRNFKIEHLESIGGHHIAAILRKA